MKKLTAFLLATVMVLSLCACSGGAGNTETEPKLEGLCVGFAKENITPDFEVGLSGYSNGMTRRFNGKVHSYIYLTCIAITEGEDTVLLFSQDLLYSDEGPVDDARQKITAATGIPADRIMFSATHTHSGPATTYGDAGSTSMWELYVNAAVKAAQKALADRAPTTIYGNDVEVTGMNYVRHYKMKDGTLRSQNDIRFDMKQVDDYATEIDDEMVLVKFDRADESKKDVLLMNWQAHPCFTSDMGNGVEVSADFIAPTRDTIENSTGMEFIYFTGAVGNHATESHVVKDKNYLTVNEYGQKLAKAAIDALPTLQKIEGEGIKTTQVDFEYATNRDELDRLTEAKEAMKYYNEKGSALGNAKLIEMGFVGYYHPNAIVARAERPEKGSMELNALYVAGMAFITAPYEMFSNASIQIKNESPFAITVVCGNANESHSYVPSDAAYDYDAYEAEISYFARGCAEAAADEFVRMLKTLQ